MALKEYRQKRDFHRTPEPTPKRGSGKGRTFVVQKHEATRLHYDFRLELGGTLKSWALPKGLPFAHGEKRLAVQVEDHPRAYADFEGTIPKGQYGGGTVMVWDRGTYEPLSKSPLKDLKGGKLHVTLQGEKLHGEWYLVRLRREDRQWLIIRGGDSLKPLSKRASDRSVLSKKTMKQLARKKVSPAQKPSPRRSKAPRKTRPKAALPLPAFVDPMKARLASTPPAGEWFYEIKLDGWRALALKSGSQVRLLSRNETDLGAKFPEIMKSLAALKAQNGILDGEIVALDKKGRPAFQLLQAYDIGQEQPPIFFYVFDLLQLNGHDLKNEPIEVRKKHLAALLKNPPGIIRHSAVLGDDAEGLMEQVRRIGLEGLIGKRRGSKYEAGRRSASWIKLKFLQAQEFVIGGYTDPEGSRSHFGALIVGFYKAKQLLFAAKVGTGFNARLLRSLHDQLKKIRRTDCPFANLPLPSSGKWGQAITRSEMKFCHWVDPILVCQVKFAEWTREARLRQPVFLGLRNDKAASKVIREGSP